MEKQNIKETIKKKAVELFSEKGFHGTSIREIAKASQCSLPMLYYYYNNKNDLFEEVAYHEFILLIERLNASITLGVPLLDIYYQAIKQRLELNPYDKGVYKLALKVWLGFDGSIEVRDKLMKWENERLERTKEILGKACSDPELLPVFSNIMVRIMENMIARIVLLDEIIPDEEIKKEFNFMLESVKGK
ncbi:MAG: TetR/AcrR family transcriptional regulator [Heliobacteriaceae bacterium]|nr:TetR/AcrR family transcriptional regulator [Heliobacteriaceae bacterium]